MNKSILLVFLLVAQQVWANDLFPLPTEQYSNRVCLNDPGQLDAYLYWSHTNETIRFEIISRRTAWILFGLFDPASYSDVIMASASEQVNGLAHFSDRKLIFYNMSESLMPIDKKQDWTPLMIQGCSQFVTYKFERLIKLTCGCDKKSEDLDFKIGPNQLIFVRPLPQQSQIQTTFRTLDLLDDESGPYDCTIKPSNETIFNPTGPYGNYDDLVDDGVYRLYWNFTSTEFIGEIHVKTKGWVAFGLSPDGQMYRSDVIVGWISDQRVVNFTDRFVSQNYRPPTIDKSQDWHLLHAVESDGYTVFKFSRKLVLCDPNDRNIEEGSPVVIVAWGDSDPGPNEDISYHGFKKRATKRLNLISNSNVNKETLFERDTDIYDFAISNIVLPVQPTTYVCRGFQVPKNLTTKRHIYKWQLFLPEINRASYYHVLVYECDNRLTNQNETTETKECLADKDFVSYCQTLMFGWFYGADLINVMPENTGFPFGGDTDFRYFYLEVHYDNPSVNQVGFIDHLVFRFFTTSNLRPNELGTLSLTTDPSAYGITIPPRMTYFPIRLYCHNQILSKILANQNVTIVKSSPHTRLAGVDVRSRLIRNNVDIGTIFRNKYYHPGYQSDYLLKRHVNLTKSDALITECIYNTADRRVFTTGGLAIRNEICLQVLTYYPRNKQLRSCSSFPYLPAYWTFYKELNKSSGLNLQPGEVLSYAFMNDVIARSLTYYNRRNVSDYVKSKYFEFFSNTSVSVVMNGLNYTEGPLDPIQPISPICVSCDEFNNMSLFGKLEQRVLGEITFAATFLDYLAPGTTRI